MKVELTFKDGKGITELKGDKDAQKVKAAGKIIAQMKSRLIKRFPEIACVFHYITFVPVQEDIYMESDGHRIFYSPKILLQAAAQRKMGELEYRCMHILAHGLLGHFDMAAEYEKSPVMHMVMDLTVYKLLDKLGMQENFINLYMTAFVMRIMNSNLTLKAIYKEAEKSPENKKELLRGRKKILVDDHRVWYRDRKFKIMIDIPDMAASNGRGQEDGRGLWKEIRNLVTGSSDADMRQIYKSLEKGLSNTNGVYGDAPGDAEKMFGAANTEPLDYTSILQKFFRDRESCAENIDSIDKAMYAWGWNNYGDVAFIEPEVETQTKALNTVVLAIDTSGSCDGEVMERFVTETKQLFSQLKDVKFKKFVLLQCDAEIKKADSFDSAGEMTDAALADDNGMEMFGFGGTDFRPVFEYVDKMIENGDKVDCLIYLTDGYGPFPEKTNREYETFFVLDMEDVDADWIEFRNDFIPEWINKVYMR